MASSPLATTSSSLHYTSTTNEETTGGLSLLNKHFNQALTWFKPNHDQTINSSSNNNENTSNNKSFSLNAYLTYVTLKLPLIMQGINTKFII